MTSETALVPSPRFYRSWFINQYGHLRAFWRIVTFIVITILLLLAIRWLDSFISFPDEGDAMFTLEGLAGSVGFTVALIAAALITLKRIDRRPTVLLGLSMSVGWGREFLIGIAIGVVMISINVGCLWVGGWARLTLNDLTLTLSSGVSKALLFFLVAALLEELVLRGYILQAFIEGSRSWIAVVLLSSVFSILHFDNPDATVLSAFNIFLAGILLSVAYLKTRSLWLPTGLHLGWNWMQASFWGLGVSGYHVDWSVFAAEVNGAEWISGGKFGAEASIFATATISLASYLIWKTGKLGVSERLASAWQEFPQGYKRSPISANPADHENA